MHIVPLNSVVSKPASCILCILAAKGGKKARAGCTEVEGVRVVEESGGLMLSAHKLPLTVNNPTLCVWKASCCWLHYQPSTLKENVSQDPSSRSMQVAYRKYAMKMIMVIMIMEVRVC